ncbi:MAG: hypothetical protein [Wigfec virus K19_94]|nr:MAG: hypothetical protein [Wigfec virus K19_94]
MYKKIKMAKTSLRVNESREGETIEQKIDRVVNNQEAISDEAPIIYTERKDGVIPAYDPRTDRFDVAIDAMTAVSKSNTAKRESSLKEREKALKELEQKQKGEEGEA